MEMVLVYITTKDKSEAQRIGRALVQERFAACVNILDGMESIYWWEGKVESSQEAILIAKTKNTLVEKLMAKVKELHSYSVPCVLALPISQGNPGYLSWLRENC